MILELRTKLDFQRQRLAELHLLLDSNAGRLPQSAYFKARAFLSLTMVELMEIDKVLMEEQLEEALTNVDDRSPGL